MWFSGFFFLILSDRVEVFLWWITGLSHLFKWENLHNWWLTKYFFAPLYPNQKPWITGNIHIELKAGAVSFKVRDTNSDTYKKSRCDLRRTIKQAKRQYRIKIEFYYTSSDAHRMWQGLKTITDYKGNPSRELPIDASLPDEVNVFYAPFEASNTEACVRAPAVLDDCVITLLVADVSKTLTQVNIHKAAGPNRLPARLLKACTDQLASVFTDIFLPDRVCNTYMFQAVHHSVTTSAEVVASPCSGGARRSTSPVF